ncbi:hypothetical protein ACFWYW_38105 [Nonomuraea sp. NPDC059023]|uniref:hypothetical protein n=1 Tax=unclassified Nonomuraea TaxID=2593643 RepID=UPI0036820B39
MRVRAGEHIVEISAESAVPVPDQEPEPVGSFAEFHQQVARLLRRPGTGRVSRDTENVQAPRFDPITNYTYRRLRNTVSTWRKSHARMPQA